MKEKIRHLIADRILKKAEIKLAMRNLTASDRLFEEIQNQLLDELRLLDDEIETLRRVLKELK
jgi:hypothetical protein